MVGRVAELASRGCKIVATPAVAVTYNEKAIVFFYPCSQEGKVFAGASVAATASAGHSESLLRQMAKEYHMLLLQSGRHLVRVFE